MNVHFSNEYRKYNTDLPLFLHNRPRDFVQHVSTCWTSAQDIPPGNIVQLDKRSFRVTSVDSSNTYHVSFGCNSDASMPYCECYDWKKYHWPCKHFCAIFQHVATHGWNSLAADYRDSPYFCLDSDLFQSQAGIPTTPAATVAEQADAADAPSAATEKDNEESTAGPKCSLSACAKDCREILREITDLTYLCTDVCSLAVLQEQLKVAMCTLRQHVPQDAGLLLADRKSQKSSSTRQRPLLQNIPTRSSKSKVRQAGRTVSLPVGEEPLNENQPEPTVAYSALDKSVGLDVSDCVTESAVAENDVHVTTSGTQEACDMVDGDMQSNSPQGHCTLPSDECVHVSDPAGTEAPVRSVSGKRKQGKVTSGPKRARFDSACPVSSIRYYFTRRVDDSKSTKTRVLPQCNDTVVVTARLETQRSRLACAVLLSENEAVRHPSKKLIMTALSEPADGCLGNILRESDYLSLLPGQWLSDNVSSFALLSVVHFG